MWSVWYNPRSKGCLSTLLFDLYCIVRADQPLSWSTVRIGVLGNIFNGDFIWDDFLLNQRLYRLMIFKNRRCPCHCTFYCFSLSPIEYVLIKPSLLWSVKLPAEQVYSHLKLRFEVTPTRSDSSVQFKYQSLFFPLWYAKKVQHGFPSTQHQHQDILLSLHRVCLIIFFFIAMICPCWSKNDERRCGWNPFAHQVVCYRT